MTMVLLNFLVDEDIHFEKTKKAVCLWLQLRGMKAQAGTIEKLQAPPGKS